MNAQHLRAILLKLQDRLSDNDRKRLHFFLGNDVPRRIRDDQTLGGTLSLIESLFDQDKINEEDFTFLINAFDEIQCMDAVKVLREHMRRMQDNGQNHSVQSLASMLLADQDADKYCVKQLFINQENKSGNNNVIIDSNNININPMTTILRNECVRSEKRRTSKPLNIIRTIVLLLIFLLTIILAIIVVIFITRMNRLKKEIKTKNMDIINQRTKNYNSTQEIQRLTKQMKYLRYARLKQNHSRSRRSFFDNLSLCSKWNRTGETVAKSLPELQSITIGNDDKLYIVDNSTGKYRVQVYNSSSKFGRILKEEINAVLYIDEDGTIYTTSYSGYIEVWTIDNNESMIIDYFCKQCHRIWIDPNNEDIYIIESSRHRIVKFNIYTNEIVTVAGEKDVSGSSNQRLDYPYDMYITEKKDIYVVDLNNNRIQKWEKDRKSASPVVGETKTPGNNKILLNEPRAVMVDEKNKLIYVVDMQNNRLMRWIEKDPKGPYGRLIVGDSGKLTDYSIIEQNTCHLGLSGRSVELLNNPQSFAFDSQSNLFIADKGNERVQKFVIDNRACFSESESCSNFDKKENWDYYGNDFPARYTYQNTYADCCAHCSKNSTCMAFTWRRDSDECHVKYNIGNGGHKDEFANAGRRQDIQEREHVRK